MPSLKRRNAGFRVRKSRTLLFALFAASAELVAGAADKPNDLFILVDDLKPPIGAYSDEYAKSPNIDRLAKEGMKFDMAYRNQAVCPPSISNLVLSSRSTSTGLYSLGLNFPKTYPDAITMPQYFAQHGYPTSRVGKIYHIGHGNTDDETSWTEPYQFEPAVDYALPESPNGQLTHEEAYFTNAHPGVPNKQLPRGPAWQKADVSDNAYSDGRIADEGIRRLKNYAADGNPFFLALGFTKPHLPKEAGAPISTAEYGLFDYTNDPWETRKLADDRTETLAQLKALLATQPQPKEQRERN